MLHNLLRELATRFVYERGKPFAGSEFANFIRHDLAIEARKHIMFLPTDLKVKASVGQGNWAAVPWLAFFDPLVTTTATKGYYVVYLINAQTAEIILSLNQGTTEAYKTFGEAKGRDHLRKNAHYIKSLLAEDLKGFDTNQIDLGSQEGLPLGYMAGHAFGRKYDTQNMDPTKFYDDLKNILRVYESLVGLGGTTPIETLFELSGSQHITEARKYLLSRRIERSPTVRAEVLKRRGYVCEGCGLDPKIFYNYRGRPENTPLDVHHAVPLNHLAEGEQKRYRIPSDFLVLCPTCHRVIHKQNNPWEIDQLKKSISFIE